MNFDDSSEDTAFRRDSKQWLAANAPRFEVDESAPRAEGVRMVRAWQACKAAAGFAALTWPAALGGRACSEYQQLIFRDEEAKYRLPADLPHGGVDVVMPTLFRFAQPEQYSPFLAATRNGEVIWSILFSEPNAGSDVSASRLAAVRQGDRWILNGQKTWSSAASDAQWGLLLARTDPSVPKHKGLSCFIVDMRSAGVTVRPIRFIEGDTHGFDEVFFSDVRVPDAQLIGKPGDGWKIFLSTLAVDRFGASAQRDIAGSNFDIMFALAQKLPGKLGQRIDEGEVRQRLADYYVDVRAVENLRARHLTQLSRGGELGPETAIGKLILSNRLQEMAAFFMDAAGAAGTVAVDAAEPGLAAMRAGFFMGAGLRIGAGTDEIIRNSIGERVLGLPAEARADKDAAFQPSSR